MRSCGRVGIDPRTPVIVGSGQVVARDVDEQHAEPVALIARALREAGQDSGAGEQLLRRADSVRCVPVVGWHYRDAAALVAEELGARPCETAQSGQFGGDGPQLLINDTAASIAAGELEVALIGGGEAVTFVRDARRDGRLLAWRSQEEDVPAARTVGEDHPPVTDAEGAAGLAPPVYMYALIESAVRAVTGDSPEAHLRRIAGLWSRFSEVAAENPNAWLRQAYTAEEIATPTPANRLVAAPYTKLLTANIQVNLAAGLILTSAGAAERAGVPKDRWVFVHAGAQVQERWHVGERHTLAASPAIRAAGRGALERAGVSIDEVAHLDVYSCFPSAVEVAARELGLDIDDPGRPLTVTGGLTFAGGPGNNYVSHSVATLVQRLREDPEGYGLATAVGWYLTKNAAGVYSSRPPRQMYSTLTPELQLPPPRTVVDDHTGPAAIEAYTIQYDRDGGAEAAIVSAITPDGARALVRSTDPEVVEMILTEPGAGAPLELSGGAVVGASVGSLE